MGLFNTILQKLGFVKDKAVEAVAGKTLLQRKHRSLPWKPLPLKL